MRGGCGLARCWVLRDPAVPRVGDDGLLGAICFGSSGLGWVAARVCVVRVNRFVLLGSG